MDNLGLFYFFLQRPSLSKISDTPLFAFITGALVGRELPTKPRTGLKLQNFSDARFWKILRRRIGLSLTGVSHLFAPPGGSIRPVTRLLRCQIPFINTQQPASNIRYHASHHFSNSCFHLLFFLFPCTFSASPFSTSKCYRQSERIWRPSWICQEKRNKICFHASCGFNSMDTSCLYLMWPLDRWKWVRRPPCFGHFLIITPISCLTYARHVCSISCIWFSS